METTSTLEVPRRARAPRRAVGAIVVAGVYALLVLGTPLIVRYGPEPEVSVAAGRVPITEVAVARCAYAPEFGRSCKLDAVPSTPKSRVAFFTK